MSERAWLAAVCASELGTLLVFSNFSALLPLLQKEWSLSNGEAGCELLLEPTIHRPVIDAAAKGIG